MEPDSGRGYSRHKSSGESLKSGIRPAHGVSYAGDSRAQTGLNLIDFMIPYEDIRHLGLVVRDNGLRREPLSSGGIRAASPIWVKAAVNPVANPVSG